MKTFLLFTLFISTHLVCAQNQNQAEIIRQARQSSNEAIKNRDVERISTFWVDDYVVIRGSGVIAAGKETNEAEWRRIFKDAPKTYFERIPTEILISNHNPDLAWETGIWKGFNTYSKGGRYSAQWKRKDDEWKIQAELFVALEQ